MSDVLVQNTRRAAVALLAAAAVALAGCSSSGGRAHHASPPPGRPQTAGSAPLAPVSKAAATVIRANRGHRPNIVVVMLDDMRYDELRFAPNTRRFITRRGLRFVDSYSPYPLCCPARASFLLGQYAHNHGVLYHTAPYGFGAIDDSDTVGSRLQAAGYQTALIGKYLNKYGVMRSKVTGQSSVHYVPRGWTHWLVGLDGGWGGRGGTYNYFDFTQNIDGHTVHHRQGDYSSDIVARQTRRTIREFARSPKPFFLWVTPVAPHFGFPRESDDPRSVKMSNGKSITITTPARPDWVKGRFDAVITHAFGVRANGRPEEADVSDKPHDILRWPEMRPVEKREVRDMERQRAESIYAWDRDFGRIVRTLKRTGRWRNTIIMFTSDNGYWNGEHRQRQGKVKPYEPVLKVPFVVAGPGIRRGVRYQPITTFDLTATIIDAARAHRLPKMDGASRLPQMVGPDAGWTRPIVTEGLMTGLRRSLPYFAHGLTESGLHTGRYQLTMYSTGESELYDLLKDPLELTNVYDDPGYRRVRDELVGLWVRYRRCRADACRVPLPHDLQEDDGFLARLAAREHRATVRYYDTP